MYLTALGTWGHRKGFLAICAEAEAESHVRSPRPPTLTWYCHRGSLRNRATWPFWGRLTSFQEQSLKGDCPARWAGAGLEVADLKKPECPPDPGLQPPCTLETQLWVCPEVGWGGLHPLPSESWGIPFVSPDPPSTFPHSALRPGGCSTGCTPGAPAPSAQWEALTGGWRAGGQ